MNRNTHPFGRRMSAAAGIMAWGLIGLAGGTTMAEADEGPPYGNIDQQATGSIIVHKHLNGDGTEGKPDGSGREGTKPVDNVTFAAYPITSLDLSKAADWTTLSTLQVPDDSCADPANPTLTGQVLGGSAGEATTAGGGIATIAGLPVKAYLVCETKAPSNIVQKAKPFVVTIPYPNTANGGEGNWLYNVNVYPKNEEVSIDKTVDPQAQNGYGLGSVVTFPVTTIVPTLDAASYFKYYQVKDVMDARFTNVSASKVTLGGNVLTPGVEYNVVVDQNTVMVNFTRAGLTALKNAPGAEVQVFFQGTVSSIGDGSIKNKAQLITDTEYATTPPPNEPPTPPIPPNPPESPEVVTHWGDVQVLKVDANKQDKGLQGATFQVYEAQDPYAADCSTAQRTGTPIQVAGQTTFTSGANGVVSIAGLFVSDSKNAPVNADHRCYVLVETTAPAGFVLPPDPETPLTVKIGQTETATAYDATIPNTKERVPGLPMTGAASQLLMTAGGISLLVIAGIAVAIIRSRKRRIAAE
ncbi:MAG: SpaH/EbpB family LPXTG-anchored major pilin [Propionibacteriaceae bacterium]|nr:SpaH/EbpB family LPXTG-anchored major pilin [Propionibacteriaceae bacterium]